MKSIRPGAGEYAIVIRRTRIAAALGKKPAAVLEDESGKPLEGASEDVVRTRIPRAPRVPADLIRVVARITALQVALE